MRIKSRAHSSRTIHDQLRNAAFLQRKICFRLSDIQNVQRFRNVLVHEFYGLKANQMKKIRASFHEYPDVEEIKLESS